MNEPHKVYFRSPQEIVQAYKLPPAEVKMT